MTHDFSLFTSHKTLLSAIHITLADGTLKKVSVIGQIPLNPQLTLHNVLYVPGFKFNLLSVGKLLADYSLCALFYLEKCLFQDLTTNLVMDSTLKADGLYKIKLPIAKNRTLGSQVSSICSNISSTHVTSNNSSCNFLPIDVLHVRLGHTSVSKMQHIPMCKHILLASFSYDICMMVKLTRLPFSKSSIKTTSCFQLVHMDL